MTTIKHLAIVPIVVGIVLAVTYIRILTRVGLL